MKTDNMNTQGNSTIKRNTCSDGQTLKKSEENQIRTVAEFQVWLDAIFGDPATITKHKDERPIEPKSKKRTIQVTFFPKMPLKKT